MVILSSTRGASSIIETVTPSPAYGSLYDLPPAKVLQRFGHQDESVVVSMSRVNEKTDDRVLE